MFQVLSIHHHLTGSASALNLWNGNSLHILAGYCWIFIPTNSHENNGCSYPKHAHFLRKDLLILAPCQVLLILSLFPFSFLCKRCWMNYVRTWRWKTLLLWRVVLGVLCKREMESRASRKTRRQMWKRCYAPIVIVSKERKRKDRKKITKSQKARLHNGIFLVYLFFVSFLFF